MAGMIEQIRACRYAKPFIPFKIRTLEGKDFLVSDFAHVGTPPGGKRVVACDLDDTFIFLTESKIGSVEKINSLPD